MIHTSDMSLNGPAVRPIEPPAPVTDHGVTLQCTADFIHSLAVAVQMAIRDGGSELAESLLNLLCAQSEIVMELGREIEREEMDRAAVGR